MNETINPSPNNGLDLCTLIESIRRGNCILLLGPQASFDLNVHDYLPLTTSLAHYLAKKGEFADDENLVNPDDIAHVAQLFFEKKKSHLELEQKVKEFYADYQNLTSDFHKDMAELPFTMCINTTLDNFFVNALTTAGKEPVLDYYNFKRAHKYAYKYKQPPTVAKPYIFNLYGHCDNLESLVLTEDDLLEFLVNVIKGSPDLPSIIPTQFAKADINFLFVGFGFHSWHNRILLHTLNEHDHRNQSLAIEDPSFFDHPFCRQTAVFYTSHHKIRFEQLSWLEFARELRHAYTPTVTLTVSTPQLPPNAPKVFLCYASEDRNQVEQLGKQLLTAGIEPWQDKQNLRAGDDWNQLLVHVIQKVVNYVVVVQTPVMTGQDEGYFYKEIATALDRQKNFSTGVRFILPIMLSDCNLLVQLHDFHAIRLDVSGGFQQLVDAIKTDWQQRRKPVVA